MENSLQVKSLDGKTLNLNKIGIFYNISHKKAESEAERLEKILNNNGISSIQRYVSLDKAKKIDNFDPDISLAFVIGGDGTILGAARFYAAYGVPVFGINTGRLGFLSQLNPDDIETGVKKLLKGEFIIDERLMLKAYNEDGNNKFCYNALNDIVIKGGLLSRTSQLFLYINGKHVCDYLADGLITSTPTGSTAYTLSAGGPVVVPELEAIVIVPICPHALTSRPLVVPAGEEIVVKVNSDSEFMYLTADGQENVRLTISDAVHIRQYEHKARLIMLEKENNGFYSVLREKLHWGVAPGS